VVFFPGTSGCGKERYNITGEASVEAFVFVDNAWKVLWRNTAERKVSNFAGVA
jgi:hypothetical protein